MNLVECINRCKGIQLLITKADKVITKLPENSLTPIPNINKQKIKNKFENKELANAERTAVYIRRLEYSTGMIKTKKKDNYDINIGITYALINAGYEEIKQLLQT